MKRLDEPLRVAIAGRVKAGKSTLLNALVGERLAATDAGECTRIVTWYRNALGYRVVAELRPERLAELAFTRQDGALEIDLGDLALETIERIEVGWPSQKLAELTLIDTPGLASADEGTSERTTRALLDRRGRRAGRRRRGPLPDAPPAPIGRPVPRGVHGPLGRPCVADQRGRRPVARRRDRRRAAGRPRLGPCRSRPATPRTSGSASLPRASCRWPGSSRRPGRRCARRSSAGCARSRASPRRAADYLLLSVDRFRDADLNPLGEEIREELLDRLGLFGLRLAVRLLVDGEVRTATELSGRCSSGPGSASSSGSSPSATRAGPRRSRPARRWPPCG